MQKRIIPAGLFGMNQDMINPNINTKHAFEIKNFRINPTANSNGIELTSEKGTRLVPVGFNDEFVNSDELTFGGLFPPKVSSLYNQYKYEYKIIGHCVIGNSVTLFVYGVITNISTQEQTKDDWIIRLDYDEDSEQFNVNLEHSYYGDFNFDKDHLIECIPCYESEDIKKIYWIDGLNYPRVINIEHEYTDLTLQDWFHLDHDPFCFYQEIQNGTTDTISVSKSHVGGLFYAGVMQYAMSFYNRNAQETPIVYVTPLEYVAHKDRGEAPNKQLGCAFKVSVTIGEDDYKRFEYVRIYSIYRTSENGAPQVKVIRDIKCSDMTKSGNNYITSFTDTNEQGYDFDAYRLLVNSDHIIPSAIGFKDQKMFLGNYQSTINIQNKLIYESILWFTDDSKKVRYRHANYDNRRWYDYINQLEEDSQTIRTFKYNEYYKFGLQFQDKFGQWSDIFIIGSGASRNTEHPVFDYTDYDGWVFLPYAKTSRTLGDIKTILGDAASEYVNVRPVVSYPTQSERSVLCQGVANPTVFNVTQRTSGGLYSQASWFFRPFFINDDTNTVGSNVHTNTPWYIHDGQAYGAYPECRCFKSLFPSDDLGGELQNMYFDSGSRQNKSLVRMTEDEAQNLYQNFYYVDHTIMTLNSPDVDFDDNLQNIDLSQYNVRITGYIPFSSDVSKQMILAESPLFLRNLEKENDISEYLTFYDTSTKLPVGFCDNIWRHKHGRIISRLSWYDEINGLFRYSHSDDKRMIFSVRQNIGAIKYLWNNDGYQYMYNTYPFQREYLNNYSRGEYTSSGALDSNLEIEDINSSKIIKKVLGNLKYACKTNYFNLVDQTELQRIDDIEMHSFDTDQYIKVGGHTYCGNIDQLITTTSNYDDKSFTGHVIEHFSAAGQGLYSYDGSTFTTPTLTFVYSNGQLPGYPIVAGDERYSDQAAYQNQDNVNLVTLSNSFNNDSANGYTTTLTGYFESMFALTPNVSSKDPIIMRYRSNKHIVFGMEKSSGVQYVFPQPTTKDGSNADIKWWNDMPGQTMPWLSTETDYNTESEINISNEYFCFHDMKDHDKFNQMLFLCELYKDVDPNYLDNTNKLNNYNRTWTVCGRTYSLSDQSDLNQNVKFMEGDTFFQRYDCLKTVPYSRDDQQSIVEIASFMCETHVNIDGRYDENRGLQDNTFINNGNFNLINKVYGQDNNFFQYNILDEDDFKTRNFPTRFTWSLNKTNGQPIDEWTRTNTAAFYDCDGDKGAISSIRRFNGRLFAFQERGISNIKYNENVALSTENGVPVELGNSGKVQGVDYISETIGSQNKWSCISTPYGVFFVDNNTPGIYRLGGGEQALTKLTRDTMQRWFESNNKDTQGFVNAASYDRNTDDVMFMYTDNDGDYGCLAYNTGYNVFTSFYDYEGFVDNIGKHSLNIHDNTLWFLRESTKYNCFYGNYKPYWVTFVSNAYSDNMMMSNCVFDNVWYNADVLHKSNNQMNNYESIQEMNDEIPEFDVSNYNTGWYETFDEIEVSNDYQYARFSAKYQTQTPGFQFIKKFRTWRVPVPRQNRNGYMSPFGRERMRNSWLKVKLKNNNPTADKMVLRNVYMDAFY